MKVLVTGATGFLGSHIVKALLKDGYKVIVLKRSFSNIRRLEHLQSQLVMYDLDKCDITQIFKEQKINTIIHTAASYGRKGENAQQMLETNVAFPVRLLETASNFKIDMFLNTDTVLEKYLNNYALSKSQFRDWGQYFAESNKIKFVDIKLEHMYGPGDDLSKFTTYVIKNCLDNVSELKLTFGEQQRDFIYIDDVVLAYLLLLKKAITSADIYQEYQLGSGVGITIRNFVETVKHLTNSKTKLNFGAVPYRKNEVMKSIANINKLKEIGWQPSISLFDGIIKCIQEEV